MAIMGLILIALGLWLGLSKGLFPLLKLKEEAGYASILEGPPIFKTLGTLATAFSGDFENDAVKKLDSNGILSVLHRLALYAGSALALLGVTNILRAWRRSKREKLEDSEQEAAFKALLDGKKSVKPE